MTEISPRFFQYARRSEGLIGVKTRWKEYSRLVSREEAFLAVEKCQPGASRPKDLFEFFIEDMEEEYERSKVCVKGGGWLAYAMPQYTSSAASILPWARSTTWAPSRSCCLQGLRFDSNRGPVC